MYSALYMKRLLSISNVEVEAELGVEPTLAEQDSIQGSSSLNSNSFRIYPLQYKIV